MSSRNKKLITLIILGALGIAVYFINPFQSSFEKAIIAYAYSDNLHAPGNESQIEALTKADNSKSNIQSLNSLSKGKGIAFVNMAFIAAAIPNDLKESWLNTTTDETVYRTELFALTLSHFISETKNLKRSSNIERILEDYGDRDELLFYTYLLHANPTDKFKLLLIRYLESSKTDKSLFPIYLNHKSDIKKFGLLEYFKGFEDFEAIAE